MNRNFRKERTVGFPRPLLLSDSVLVESFEDGVGVSTYTDMYSNGVTRPLHLNLAHFILTAVDLTLILTLTLCSVFFQNNFHDDSVIL